MWSPFLGGCVWLARSVPSPSGWRFVALALNEGCNFARLYRAFHFSRKTGYKWIRRFKQLGPAGLADASRRPRHSPRCSSPDLEALVVELRKKRRWGGRKIAARLDQSPSPSFIHPSTASAILKRHGLSLETVPFDLQNVVEEVGVLMSARASEKNLELIVRCSPDAPMSPVWCKWLALAIVARKPVKRVPVSRPCCPAATSSWWPCCKRAALGRSWRMSRPVACSRAWWPAG